MFGLQPTHIIFIFVIALLVFGPSRLPAIGKAAGKTIREFQSSMKEVTQGLQTDLTSQPAEPPKEPPKT
jgi:sec-independent protein translocase protein TatA